MVLLPVAGATLVEEYSSCLGSTLIKMTFLTSTVLYVNYISIKLEKTSLFKGCPMTGGMS